MDLIQARRGTAAEWTAADPVLAAGEPGHELDTGKVKFGDGATAWSALDYVGDHAIGTGGGGGALPIVSCIDTPAGVASGSISASLVDVPGPMSIVVPAGSWIVSGFILSGAYTARGRLYDVTAAAEFSRVGGFTQQGDQALYLHQFAPRPLTVVGASHTIKAEWQARDSTGGMTLYRRFLMAQPY